LPKIRKISTLKYFIYFREYRMKFLTLYIVVITIGVIEMFSSNQPNSRKGVLSKSQRFGKNNLKNEPNIYINNIKIMFFSLI
jgi:cytochrome c biogenesis factor